MDYLVSQGVSTLFHKEDPKQPRRVGVNPDGSWVWTDYLSILLGLVDGAMGALPDDSHGYFC